MHPIDDRARPIVSFLVILIAFAWVACAYILGAEAGRMILHPVVPILLILLLLGFRSDESVRRAVNIAIVFMSIWLFVRLQSVFMPFIIGFALAYVVYVALTGLQKIPVPLGKDRRVYLPRRAAVAILLILLAGIMAFFVLGIVPQLMNEGGRMREGIGIFYGRIKNYATDMLSRMEAGDYPLQDRIPESWKPTVQNAILKMSAYVQEKIPTAAARLGDGLGTVLVHLSSGLLGTIRQGASAFFIIIVFIYAVESFQSHTERIKSLIPTRYSDAANRYLAEIDINMRAFLKGQLAVIVIISGISILIYTIIRVPFALLVGLLAGLCNAIPTIGPFLGGVIAVLATLVGFVAGDYTLSMFLLRLVLVLGAVFGIQLLDNSLISPKIMSSALNIHPLVVLFAVLLAANLVGVWGAVLAIPGIVVCKAFIKVSGEMRKECET